jgi:hypothetical protein
MAMEYTPPPQEQVYVVQERSLLEIKQQLADLLIETLELRNRVRQGDEEACEDIEKLSDKMTQIIHALLPEEIDIWTMVALQFFMNDFSEAVDQCGIKDPNTGKRLRPNHIDFYRQKP